MTFVLFVGFVVSLALTHAQTPGPRPTALTADELFSGEALLDIWIHMNSRDWQQLRASFQENTFYPCDVEWRGERAYNAACRSRGQGSRSGVKPGLLVQFDRYVTGQTFLGLTSLVLDNLWQDSSMLKERASMRLFERMGLSAPRESHTRLYVGSGREYVGVYAVVENIDERFLQRKYGEHEGHLYEYRWRNEYYLTDLGDDFEPYAARFEPRNHETDSRFSLFKPIRDLIRAINAASESNLEADLAPYLDIRSFLAHVAVENFLSDWDGLLGDWGLDNFYLYRAAATNVSHVISWDKDYTFMWLEMPPSHRGEQNVLFKKAWAAPAFRRYYLDRLNAAAASATASSNSAFETRLSGSSSAAARICPYSRRISCASQPSAAPPRATHPARSCSSRARAAQRWHRSSRSTAPHLMIGTHDCPAPRGSGSCVVPM